jgi:RNA polymerase sigma-70 factor (ECF subfamily)
VIGSAFQEVLAAAREGSEPATVILWQELHPRLLRYLRAMDPRVAEDVESETWLLAARRLGSFQGNEAQFLAWMFTIARHALIDVRRKSMRRPSVPVAPEVLLETPGRDDPAATVLERLDTEAALALMSRLPADQAEVILLRVLSGLDTARVATILGKRPGTVRVLQHRGLRRLADLLARPDGPDRACSNAGIDPDVRSS